MPRRFPEKCRPFEWEGPYAVMARKETDHGFQRLITSILLADLGGQVHPSVSPPKPDGKVDLWIEEGPNKSGLFLGPYPAIVECKYHEEATWERLRDTWGEVRRGLQAAGEEKWTGREKPWLGARSYIYCVSSELDADLLLRLNNKIRNDLAALPRFGDATFADVAVHVLSWPQLREWADEFPSVADRWLGLSSADILPTNDFLAQFRDDDFRRWLRADRLPFVEPSEDAAHHTLRILRLLEEQMAKGGVILHGAGGVGKTRTAIEVGRRAEGLKKPWRVLHVNAKRGVTVQDLFREIVPGGKQTTLIIYDYIDQAANFVPNDFARHLSGYPSARIVLLGTARQPRLTGAGRAFKPVTLHPDEHHVDRILARIRAAMGAPLRERFTEAMLESIGGRRPVIALLIYDELLRRVKDGEADIAHFREASDLATWLEARLRDATRLSDGDEVEPEHFRIAKRVAAASVFAAAPQTERELVDVARGALHHFAEGALDKLAERMVKKLTESGWLIEHREELGAAHDVVTDELLESVIVAANGSIYVTELDAILGPATQSSRTLGRMALSFGRLIGDQLRNRDAEPHLRRAVAAWFERHENDVAALLGSAQDESGRDRAAYAIGAVLASNAWSGQLLARWDAVVGPWLEARKAKPEIRHLLYRALQSADTSGAMARNLTRQAAEWVSANYLQRDASFLIMQLLERLDVSAIEPLAPKLGVWLLQHGTSEEARSVIIAVLRRPELPLDLRTAAWNAAEHWLQENPLDAAAPAMFRLFVKSGPPGPQSYGTRLHLVRVHLERARTSEGRDVDSLRFALEIAQRPADRVEAATWAKKVLEHDLEPRRAAVLLAELLRPRGRTGDDEALVARAIGFDCSRVPAVDAAVLLASLLERFQSRGGNHVERRAAIDAACAWLQAHRREREAGRVIAALLRLSLGPWEREVVRIAVRWLPSHIHEREAGAILPPLMRSPVLEDRTRVVVSHALEWIHRYMRMAEAQFTIEEIVKDEELPENLRKRFARLSLDRFLQLGGGPGMSYAGRWLAEHLDALSRTQRRRFIEAAVDWIESQDDASTAEYVANGLLTSVDVRNDAWRRIADIMLVAVPEKLDVAARPFAIEALLQRRSLLRDDEAEMLRTVADRDGIGLTAGALERLTRPQVTLESVQAALSDHKPPSPLFVEALLEDIEDLSELGLLRRQFRSLPAYAFLLAWRVADKRLAERIVAATRNTTVSDLKVATQVEAFRKHLLAARDLIPPSHRPEPDEVFRRAGIDEMRLATRAALDDVQAAGEIDETLFRDVVASIENDLGAGVQAEAGRLLCRLLLPAWRSGSESKIARVLELRERLRKASTDGQRAVFRRRCEAVVGENSSPWEAQEILRLFGLRTGSYLEAKLRRHLAVGMTPPAVVIDGAIAEARAALSRRSLAAAGLVETLLAVAVRNDDHVLLEICGELKQALYPLLDRDPYDKFRVALYAHIETDWPEYSRRQRILEGLGILQPLLSLTNVADRHAGNRLPIPDDLLLCVQNVAAELARTGRFDGTIARALQRYLMLSAHRGGGRISVAAQRFAASIVARLPETVKSDLARHAYGALGDGLWPDVRAGEADLMELGLQTEEHQVNERYLAEMLFHARALEGEGLQQQLRLAEERLVDGNVGGTGYLLVPLLPLASRLGDSAFEDQVHDLVERLLLLASKFERDGFRRRSLKEAFHAWPSRDVAECTLQRVGISLGRIERLVAEAAPISIEEAMAAIDGGAKMIERDASEDVAIPLASVLAAALRCGDVTATYRARSLVGRFLEAPLTRFEELDLFTNECRRLLTAGAFGDPEQAAQCIEDLGIAPVRLEVLTADPRLPIGREVIDTGLRAAKTMLDGSWSRRAEDFLVHLVPLSARASDDHVLDSVDQLVARLRIRSGAFSRSFSRRSTMLLDTAWLDPDIGRERLRRLSILP